MTSKSELATQIIDEIAAEFQSMSFDELAEIQRQHPADLNDGWRYLREVNVGGARAHVHALISTWGLRVRTSVELTLSGEWENLSGREIFQCRYFERFKSGKLVIPTIKLWQLIVGGILIVGLFVTYFLTRR